MCAKHYFHLMMLPPIHFYFYVHVYHFVHVGTMPTEAKECISPLKLELRVVVSHTMWKLEDQYVLLTIEQSL